MNDQKTSGEPVAYRCRHSATEPWFFSDKPGYWEWQALYVEPPAPVAFRLPEAYSLAMFQMISGFESVTAEQFELVWSACRSECERLNSGKPAPAAAQTFAGFNVVEDQTIPPGHIRMCDCNQGRLPCRCRPIPAGIESLAQQIYQSWESQPGFVPWVDGGNSAKQDEARQIASRTFELALANQVENEK